MTDLQVPPPTSQTTAPNSNIPATTSPPPSIPLATPTITQKKSRLPHILIVYGLIGFIGTLLSTQGLEAGLMQIVSLYKDLGLVSGNLNTTHLYLAIAISLAAALFQIIDGLYLHHKQKNDGRVSGIDRLVAYIFLLLVPLFAVPFFILAVK